MTAISGDRRELNLDSLTCAMEQDIVLLNLWVRGWEIDSLFKWRMTNVSNFIAFGSIAIPCQFF
jgi:hypothetical protein